MKKIIYPEDSDYEDYKDIYDECEHCHVLVNFDALDDEDVIYEKQGYEEYCGFKVSAPDAVVGFVCPECGKKNKF
ncbi:MAG: hypothetical protein WCX79_00600 [Candidatus Paceibacterota bacterium]|jgi:hypothetical protein